MKHSLSKRRIEVATLHEACAKYKVRARTETTIQLTPDGTLLVLDNTIVCKSLLVGGGNASEPKRLFGANLLNEERLVVWHS